VIAGDIDRAITSFARPLARDIARFFQGAGAGNLSIEMPTHFELAINSSTAKALGLAVPPTLLSLAPARSSNSARQFPVKVKNEKNSVRAYVFRALPSNLDIPQSGRHV
jgi:hypothetical protein